MTTKSHHNRRILESLCKKFCFVICDLQYLCSCHVWRLVIQDTTDTTHEIKATFRDCVTILVAKHKSLTCDIWCGDLFDGVQ